MIYEFSHYPTAAGRLVRFLLGRAELERVRRAGFLEGEALRSVEIVETGSSAEVMLIMPPVAARVMVDVLAMIGGDAAVAARMLAVALDGMVDELRTSRTVSDLTRPAAVRRDTRRTAGLRA